ncbi:MucR family transcriptional regulator [Kordiimonas sp.]|uniref:MucR family transcriptional regulator n=1 Tax=Kordiimonas sp. TaxID=1970157 RepID=UPI003A94E7C9
MEQDKLLKEDLLALTVEIVASYVSKNSVAVDELPNLIGQVFGTLQDLGNRGTIADATPEPVVPIKKSITPDYLICLEDGKKLKMLKRHLKTRYDMTPDDYRARWGLPGDYPMVAPNYAKQRRDLAKKIGLGRGKKS